MNFVVSHDRAIRQACQQLVNEDGSGRAIPDAGNWLLDNYALLQAQSRQVREAINKKLWHKLGGTAEQRPRLYDIAKQAIHREINVDNIREFFRDYQEKHGQLSLAELWAILPIVKLALLDRVHDLVTAGSLDGPDAEPIMRTSVIALRDLDELPWNDVIESISTVHATLCEDPSGIYPKMDFYTRDQYRQQIEKLAGKARRRDPAVQGTSELRLAQGLVERARKEQTHVGLYLQRKIVFPHLIYFGGIALLTGLLLYGSSRLLHASSWWTLLLLAIPMSQVALSIIHPLINRFLKPNSLPRMDFSKEIPDDCRTFVVIPTLILSRTGVEKLLERIEIHYLANRDRNLLFGLLTDFADAASQHSPKDELLDVCAEGIRSLNKRYAPSSAGPFYLFHRDRSWNASEKVWMGRERKRGKLDDFNEFLLSESDNFALKVGALEQVHDIRWVITLDTDTQLPRDSAREMIATMAHPLNRPVLDESKIVRRGYALMQPRVSVSMESARRSRLANLYSGQTGLDPYTKAVSDVYQDLFGQASYTGKGIYDLKVFVEATRGRFPDNTLLSHDLIEGEHVRVGLVTDIEVVDDFPTTYEAFSKRKHRWVRGDWQISAWLLPRVPDAHWHWSKNPLSLLSRWKIFDNLRRSLYELTLLLFFVSGLWTADSLRRSTLVLTILLVPAFAQTLFSLLRVPPLRFWRSFLRETAAQLVRGIFDGLLQLPFLLHQALLMTDAILRTVYRRIVTHRNLLEWESAAQAELGSSKSFSLITIYLFVCPAIATAVATLVTWSENGPELLPLLTLVAWAASPLSAEFISHKVQFRRGQQERDLQFLRNLSLRTWRYFVDFSKPEDHSLVPDNIQEDPWMVAHRSSPTNMGLQLVTDVAAHDFGYLTAPELSQRLDGVIETLDHLEKSRGHFYNWYDTQTLQPLQPRYVSSVDSGNLAAALVTVKQTCLEMLEAPLISPASLKGARDHCEIIRHSLPEGARTAPIMHQLHALCSQMSGKPGGSFHWDGLLTELTSGSAKFLPGIEWLCDHWKENQPGSIEDALYWARALHTRLERSLETLHQFAPWLSGPLGKKLRVLGSESRVAKLMEELNRIPTLAGLAQQYDTIETLSRELLDADWLPASHRKALENLIEVLGPSREQAALLIQNFQRMAVTANRMFHDMDFRFLLDRDRKLMRIGYDVDHEHLDDSHYDLLASEARTGVFLAVAKGDFPREAWFRLGRKLTSYGGYRTLLSWSGTMFEYLMPALFMRTYEDSLLAESLRGAVRIQQLYARTRRVPWGISEAAHAGRDAARIYQYRAFGVPVIGLKRMDARDLVIAPYATMMAVGVDPHRATANLKDMAARGWLGGYGFFEAIDFSAGQPEIVRAFMVHHQGMAFIAMANALLDNPTQRRFHADPMVLATELLLQERLPVLFDQTQVEDGFHHEPEHPAELHPVALGHETTTA